MPINFNLNDYLNPVFVETGSAGGNGIEQALKAGFEKIYSIELSEQFHQQCEQHFVREVESGQVTLIFGDSTYALPHLTISFSSFVLTGENLGSSVAAEIAASIIP